jgi:23S rRNA (cytosine1962-C5)-methyltransferase
MTTLTDLLTRALDARAPFQDAEHASAYRIFNGFLEGNPALAIDLYGTSVVVHDHGAEATMLDEVEAFVRGKLPFVQALLIKPRKSEDEVARKGSLRFGEAKGLDRRIAENGVGYALDLMLNRDASLYLDTRSLRRWAKETLAGQKVLNTFAYTGSLGVAARAAPARQVVQTDLSRAFLNVAKVSYGINGWDVPKLDFRTGDFFEKVGELKREDAMFDCVFVDPPFFSQTDAGTVDLEGEVARHLNKIRPLIGDGGRLVTVNNALFVSGADYTKQLEALCADGYLELERRIDVDADFTGTPETRVGNPPSDPAPFNHSTKIAVLRAKRKDGRKA